MGHIAIIPEEIRIILSLPLEFALLVIITVKPPNTKTKPKALCDCRREKMAVKLRLMRFGCKHRPFYRVVVADSKSRRDGSHLEVIGYYNPLLGPEDLKKMSLKFDRVQYWLSVGALPTEPVERLLARAGLGRKGGAKSTSVVDPVTGRVITSDASKIIYPEFAAEEAEKA